MKRIGLFLLPIFGISFLLFFLKSRSYLDQNSGPGTGDISSYTPASAWEPAFINSWAIILILAILGWVFFRFEQRH